MTSTLFRVACLQLSVFTDKSANIAAAMSAIRRSVDEAATDMVVLPECWNSPYGASFFPSYCEAIPGPSTDAISAIAKEKNVWIVGGSIPEKCNETGKIFNTCPIFNRDGKLIAKHRKVHLFDIDVPGKIRFFESETLTGGDNVTTFDTEWGTVGVGICYDIRFPLLSEIMCGLGCKLLVFPGAFNTVTGPLHWELLQRARAVDNQLFVITVAPARSKDPKDYQSWGHSSIVSPWGEILATCEHEPAVVRATLDSTIVNDMRNSIPVRRQQRLDIYTSPQIVKKDN